MEGKEALEKAGRHPLVLILIILGCVFVFGGVVMTCVGTFNEYKREFEGIGVGWLIAGLVLIILSYVMKLVITNLNKNK